MTPRELAVTGLCLAMAAMGLLVWYGDIRPVGWWLLGRLGVIVVILALLYTTLQRKT